MTTASSPHPLDRLAKRHASLGPGGYLWILNVAGVEGEKIEFIPGCEIRKANKEEVEELRLLLAHFQARLQPRNPWEVSATSEPWDRPGSFRISFTELPQDKLRYHLLTFTHPSNIVAHQICVASALARGPIFHRGYELHREFFGTDGTGIPFGVGSSRTLDRILTLLPMDDDKYFAEFSSADAEDLSVVINRLEALRSDGTIDQVERPANELLSVMEIAHRELRLLGLFAIIESMITHKPKPNDPYQSIINQIRTKMTLLGNRFVRPLDYKSHLDTDAKPETVWAKMYDLRSVIAHGGRPDFASKELKMLRNREVAESLAIDAVRSILRQAAHEPQLLHDLREC